MKTLCATFLLSGLVLMLAGCGSVGSDFQASVREKFDGPTYLIQVFPGDARAVYAAALHSAESLGFHFVRGGPAQGRLEALSGVASGDTLAGARQLAMTVNLRTVAAGTEVSVLITEQVQDDFNKGAGQVTEAPLRTSPLYDAFFRGIGQPVAQ